MFVIPHSGDVFVSDFKPNDWHYNVAWLYLEGRRTEDNKMKFEADRKIQGISTPIARQRVKNFIHEMSLGLHEWPEHIIAESTNEST